LEGGSEEKVATTAAPETREPAREQKEDQSTPAKKEAKEGPCGLPAKCVIL
jgi:hypothetical protein